MVIQSWLFISFWAVISFAFLHLGFHALDKTDLLHSVPPIVMFLFKHSLVASSCFSSSYALKIQAQSTYAVPSDFVFFVYVFGSLVFRRTIEGILIHYVIRAIAGWLLIPGFSFLSLFQFPLKMLENMVAALLYVVLFLYRLHSLTDFLVRRFDPVTDIMFRSFYFTIVTFVFMMGEEKYSPTLLTGKPESLLTVGCVVLSCPVLYQVILLSKNNFREMLTRAGILWSLELFIFLVGKKNSNFSPILVLFISHWISVYWAKHSRYGDDTLVSGDLLWDGESMEGLVSIAVKAVALMIKKVLKLKEHKAKKLIKFGIEALGSVLFQSFFKITSFSEVAAFLCFTVVWLANQVLLGFKADFGIFNFLLLNVVVSCTVGQFGLHGETWLALGAAILLYAVGLKLQSIAIAYEEAQQMQFSFFDTNIGELPLTSNHPLPSYA